MKRERVWVPIASADTESDLAMYRAEYEKGGRRCKVERENGRYRLYAEFERPGW